MEVSRLVMGQSSCFSGARSQYSASSSSLPVSGRVKPGFSLRPGKICGFSDSGHFEYYNYKNKSSGVIRCAKEEIKVKEKKKIKNKLKLLKGLSKDLSTFSNVGFGFNPDEVKSNTITEAAELLMQHLEKLRAEEKELKRRKKEAKAKLKAMRMNESSLSSSSDSGDSECEDVVDMNRLKHAQATAILTTSQPAEDQVLPPPSPRILESSSAVDCPTSIVEEKIEVERRVESSASCNNLVQDYSSTTDSLCREAGSVGVVEGNSQVDEGPSKKIEVCMGGKCKKSGAAALLEEFQKMVGIEVGVTGCKCMGKCRSAPNVRVQNNCEGVQSAGGGGGDDRSLQNPLFIGVGLEDVDLIVANLLGDNRQNEVVVAAS